MGRASGTSFLVVRLLEQKRALPCQHLEIVAFVNPSGFGQNWDTLIAGRAGDVWIIPRCKLGLDKYYMLLHSKNGENIYFRSGETVRHSSHHVTSVDRGRRCSRTYR